MSRRCLSQDRTDEGESMMFFIGMIAGACVLFLLVQFSTDSWTSYTPTQEELDTEREKIIKEQKHRRRFVTPPPLLTWSEPTFYKNGKLKSRGELKTNQDYINRWKVEHFDWLEEQHE